MRLCESKQVLASEVDGKYFDQVVVFAQPVQVGQYLLPQLVWRAAGEELLVVAVFDDGDRELGAVVCFTDGA